MDTSSVELSASRQIPVGTQRIVVFDTNAYREFTPGNRSQGECRVKLRHLSECEKKSGVFVLAMPVVIWELVSHIANPNDPWFNHCLNSIVVLGEHSVHPANPEGGISMFPDADLSVCREVFRMHPGNHEQVIRQLGSLVKYIVNNAPKIEDQVALTHIKQIANAVADTEQEWLMSMQPVLAYCDPSTAKQFFQNRNDGEVREQIQKFFASEEFLNMYASYTVEKCARILRIPIPTGGELEQKIHIVRTVFSTPLHLTAKLLQKIAAQKSYNLSNPKKKRWNFVWDFQVAFSIGSSHQVSGIPLFLVTGDQELLEAAKSAGCNDRVISLNYYLKSVNFIKPALTAPAC